MYNTEHICNYHLPDVFLETDNLTDEDKDFVRNALYRNDILYIFSMDEYDESVLTNSITILYERIKKCSDLLLIMNQISEQYNNTDPLFGLMILYSFDYLYLMHKCISQFLLYDSISESDLLNLRKTINNKQK